MPAPQIAQHSLNGARCQCFDEDQSAAASFRIAIECKPLYGAGDFKG